jgi:SAM-dependent methyltransferase
MSEGRPKTVQCGPTSSVEAAPLSLVDALLGREGRLFSSQALSSFYQNDYLGRNPALDVQDVPWKAERLHEVCRLAGIERADSLLEVGCGSGVLLEEMGRRLSCPRTVGVDYSHAIARRASPAATVGTLRADGLRLPFHDSAFDLVYFADVLEHVLEPEGLLREVARVGRRVAALVPLEAGLISTPIYVLRRIRRKPTNLEQYGHIWRWHRHQVMSLIRRAGQSLQVARAYPGVVPPEQMNAMNVRGRAVQLPRAAIVRLWPRMAELLFGQMVLAIVARGSR